MRRTLMIGFVLVFASMAGCASLVSTERHRRDDMEKARRDELLRQEAEEQEAAREAEIDEFFKDHPEISDRQRAAIRKKSVIIGMPDYAVEFSLGKPTRRNDSVFSFGTHSQWVYGTSLYLYFENGILKSFQQEVIP